MEKEIERFIRYCEIDTQSDDASTETPSCQKQLDLSKLLVEELAEMGIKAELNEYGIVYGKLEGEKDLDPIGFNAHVDTASEITGANVKPRIIRNYDGSRIKLNKDYSMSPEEFSSLAAHIGDDIIVTDGNTLLGADDKAGIAIIMAILDYFVSNPQVKHHTICFCFTPDEEIGRGPENFDAKAFGAAYAYTFDGGVYDEIEMENFNAAHADVTIKGIAIHPGEAKGKMINAASLACEFDLMLPEFKRPQYTELYEGFNHLTDIHGGNDEAHLHYIIRNHDRKLLEEQKLEFQKVQETLARKYIGAKITVTIQDDYKNMKEALDKDPRAVDAVVKAMRNLGIEPKFNPIRGGTDGATFSFKGCPTPNLGTGSYNHHGRFEYLSIGEFYKLVEIGKEIVKA